MPGCSVASLLKRVRPTVCPDSFQTDKRPAAAGSQDTRPIAEGPRDRSRKGSVDKEILPLLNQLNALENFYTSSSCSGRVLLLGIPGEDSCSSAARSAFLPAGAAADAPTGSSPCAELSSRLTLSSSRGAASSAPRACASSPSHSSEALASSSASFSWSPSQASTRSTASDRTSAPEDLKGEAEKREERRRQKHSKIFLLNHHEEVNAELLLHGISACPFPCEEIWSAMLQA